MQDLRHAEREPHIVGRRTTPNGWFSVGLSIGQKTRVRWLPRRRPSEGWVGETSSGDWTVTILWGRGGGAWLDGSIDQCGLDPGPRDALASQHQPSGALRRRGEWAGPPVLDQHDEADCARQEAGGSQGDVVLAQQPTELTE